VSDGGRRAGARVLTRRAWLVCRMAWGAAPAVTLLMLVLTAAGGWRRPPARG
jgi:hypothetical protein